MKLLPMYASNYLLKWNSHTKYYYILIDCQYDDVVLNVYSWFYNFLS